MKLTTFLGFIFINKMNWFKIADNSFIQKIKEKLKTHPFTVSLASYYNIPLSEIDTNMEIEITDLEGKFSEGNGKLIRLDKKLVNNNFFDENFHFVIHEFFHWLKRRSESLFYFNDSEEVQSFVLQMTWDLINGKNVEDVERKIYPILETHFKNDENKAKDFFKKLIDKAVFLSKIY